VAYGAVIRVALQVCVCVCARVRERDCVHVCFGALSVCGVWCLYAYCAAGVCERERERKSGVCGFKGFVCVCLRALCVCVFKGFVCVCV